MTINASVQYNGGLLADIIMLLALSMLLVQRFFSKKRSLMFPRRPRFDTWISSVKRTVTSTGTAWKSLGRRSGVTGKIFLIWFTAGKTVYFLKVL